MRGDQMSGDLTPMGDMGARALTNEGDQVLGDLTPMRHVLTNEEGPDVGRPHTDGARIDERGGRGANIGRPTL
jgi:hypothetical protein